MLWRETAKTERIVCSTTECRLKEVNEKAALISEIPECMLNMWLQTTSPYVLQRVSKSCKESIFNRNSKDELMSGFVFYVCRASLSLPKAVQKEYNNERGMYANMSAQTRSTPIWFKTNHLATPCLRHIIRSVFKYPKDPGITIAHHPTKRAEKTDADCAWQNVDP